MPPWHAKISDKFNCRKFMRVPDEKLIINELGPNGNIRPPALCAGRAPGEKLNINELRPEVNRRLCSTFYTEN